MGSKCVNGKPNSLFNRASTAFQSSISKRMRSLNSPLRSDMTGPTSRVGSSVSPREVTSRYTGSPEAKTGKGGQGAGLAVQPYPAPSSPVLVRSGDAGAVAGHGRRDGRAEDDRGEPSVFVAQAERHAAVTSSHDRADEGGPPRSAVPRPRPAPLCRYLRPLIH